MKHKKYKTNIEFFKHICDYSKHGPLMQLMFIEALSKYSQHIIDNQNKIVENMDESFINPEAWISTAKELKTELDLHLS